MDRMQKYSILTLLSTIEAQVRGIREMLGIEAAPQHLTQRLSVRESEHYTSQEEDDEIEKALKMDEQRDEMLQTVFSDIQKETDS